MGNPSVSHKKVIFTTSCKGLRMGNVIPFKRRKMEYRYESCIDIALLKDFDDVSLKALIGEIVVNHLHTLTEGCIRNLTLKVVVE